MHPRPLQRVCSAVVAVVALLAAAAPSEAQPNDSSVLDRVEAMVVDVEDIMGLQALRPIESRRLSRDGINELVTSRMNEESAARVVDNEELFLQLFGFVKKRFDLAEGVADTLTEQATALYDYKTKRLYLSDWTPEDMQEYALVHEIAHAIADQHFDLGKFVDKSKSADGDLARSAVIEGQAAWVMTEWVMRQSGRTLTGNRHLAAAAAGASRHEVTEYPVFSSQPLYLRESMLFPYTDGLIFQQHVIDRMGQEGLYEVFEDPPISTQQILTPQSYFADRFPQEPWLPKFRLKGFRRTSRGDVGQFDHQLLLRQHINEDTARQVAPSWRGGRYEIWTNSNRSRAVLRYASAWAGAAAAKAYFETYVDVLRSKWDHTEVTLEAEERVEGIGDNGRFILTLDGSEVTSLEGLPDEFVSRDAKSRKGKRK